MLNLMACLLACYGKIKIIFRVLLKTLNTAFRKIISLICLILKDLLIGSENIFAIYDLTKESLYTLFTTWFTPKRKAWIFRVIFRYPMQIYQISRYHVNFSHNIISIYIFYGANHFLHKFEAIKKHPHSYDFDYELNFKRIFSR